MSGPRAVLIKVCGKFISLCHRLRFRNVIYRFMPLYPGVATTNVNVLNNNELIKHIISKIEILLPKYHSNKNHKARKAVLGFECFLYLYFFMMSSIRNDST